VPSNDILEITISTLPGKSQAALDDSRILAFLASKGITNAVKDATGLYYVVTQAGTGTEQIDFTSLLTINYTGRLLDGTVFDSNNAGTFVTNLLRPTAERAGIIPGWQVLTKFRKGTKVRLIIPSIQAYGNNVENNIIWENTPLDFDIEILEVAN